MDITELIEAIRQDEDLSEVDMCAVTHEFSVTEVYRLFEEAEEDLWRELTGLLMDCYDDLLLRCDSRVAIMDGEENLCELKGNFHQTVEDLKELIRRRRRRQKGSRHATAESEPQDTEDRPQDKTDEAQDRQERRSQERPRQFCFHDKVTYIESQHITVQSGANFYNGAQTEAKEADGGEASKGPDDNLVLQLMPVFLDNEEVTKQFVRDITDRNALEVVEAVRRYRTQKRLDAVLCHHRLWQALHDNGLYKLSERNWNKRLEY